MIFTEILCITNKEINTYNKKQDATFLVLITILAFFSFLQLIRERDVVDWSFIFFHQLSVILSWKTTNKLLPTVTD